jgi:hypothetical protein
MRAAVLSALLASAGAALQPFRGGDPNDGFTLVLFPTGTTALCLDGSSAGYYVRRGRGLGASTFLIELEGGGWCTSNADCLARASTALGSSKSWPPTGSPDGPMGDGSFGLFSNDCSINPHWCDATMIHGNYCDGASFAGHRDAPIAVNGTNIFFRGRDILDATLAAAIANEGLATAAAVMLKGCSAGGLATILHVDYVSELLHTQVRPDLPVLGVPDAGYFLDHRSTTGRPTYTPLYQWVAQAQNVSASVDAGCIAAYAPAEQWRCFMAEYTAPFLATPCFFAQDLDDSWQMTNIFDLGCSPYHGPGDCNAAQLSNVTQYRLDTLSALAPVLTSPLHAGFFTACVQHCHANIDFCFTNETVGSQSMQETLWTFWSAVVLGQAPPPGVATTVIDGPGLRNPTCTASCSPF